MSAHPQLPKMMHCYRLQLTDDARIDPLWEALEQMGLIPLYTTAEPGLLQELILQAEEGIPLTPLLEHPEIISITSYELPSIDWNEQWACHAPHYREGLLVIDLAAEGLQSDDVPLYREQIILQPGGGFGDLSHPTTRMTLQLMAKYSPADLVIDIGCGSGILTLAAIALGAKRCYGIDIDTVALEHAKHNSVLNDMAEKTSFFLPAACPTPDKNSEPLIVMNMISSEQKLAWHSLPQLHRCRGVTIISGLLAQEAEAFKKQCKLWRWRIIDSIIYEGWLAYSCQR